MAAGVGELFEMIQGYRQVVVDIRMPGVELVRLGIGEAGFRPAALFGQQIAESKVQCGFTGKLGDHRAQMAFTFAQGQLRQLSIGVLDEAEVNWLTSTDAVYRE